MATFKFTVNKMTVEFVEQEDEARVALGERFERVTFIPKNANGDFKNGIRQYIPNWQVRKSLFSSGVAGVFDLPKSDTLHLYDDRHPERKAGFQGWIHTSRLGKERIVVLDNGRTVRNTYTVERESKLKNYGAVEEWSRLFKVSEYTWEARQDTTYGRDKKTGEINTDYPWASLKHIHLADLVRGTTLITYPLLTPVWENGERTGEYYDKDQNGAKWLFATLSSIKAETLDFNTAKRQYFTNILFFNITREEMARMEAKGEIDPEVEKEALENARKFRNGETVEPGREVMVDGKPVGLNVLPSGSYMALVGTKEVFVETMSFTGRHRVAQLVAKHNGNLSLKTFVPEG
jgi:hypothetical protein